MSNFNRSFGKESKDKSVRALPLEPKADNLILMSELEMSLKNPTDIRFNLSNWVFITESKY